MLLLLLLLPLLGQERLHKCISGACPKAEGSTQPAIARQLHDGEWAELSQGDKERKVPVAES